MTRILMTVGAAFLLAALGAWAGGVPPADDIQNTATTSSGGAPDDGIRCPQPSCAPVAIGIAQPETDGTALGWDATPAGGGWGGRGADGSFAVAWENDQPDAPALSGRFAEVTVPGMSGFVPTSVEIGYLAGIANDDFCVLVRQFRHSGPPAPPVYVSVDCLDDDAYNTTEIWTSALFPLPRHVFSAGQDMTIQIRVTGNAWSGQATWGQLAVDYIKIWGVQRNCL